MMRASLPRLVGCSLLAALAALSQGAAAQCPVGSKITIDYDIPGSGYSETSDNWTTWNTSPCNGAGYRYLSHTVGDGSRKGKAIWKPAIVHEGHYRVTTGYRATENRSSDADYFAYDDLGTVVHKVVNQRDGSGCQWVEMGTFFCQPGGTCRVELDGTDDSQSDCADVTIYELLDCEGGTGGTGGSGGGTVAGRCDGIRANAAWEVCEETSTTCKGVFTDGAGCVVYCAAAGMTCTARFGGEPGCQKEAQNVLGCADNNGHLSDWCECEGPPIEPDAGQGGSGGGLPDASAGGAGGPAGTGGGTSSDSGVSDSAYDGAWGGSSGSGGSGGSESPDAAKPPGGIATGGDDGGCGCRLQSSRSPQTWILALLGIVLVGRIRKPVAQGPKETPQAFS